MDVITWIWLIAGILLMISEIVIPGGVVAFLGASAIIVALGRWTGLIEGVVDSFTYWFIISIGLVLALRRVLTRKFSSDSYFEDSDEDLEAFGEVVEVVEEVSDRHMKGRIRFRETTWLATTEVGTFAPGEKVRLIERADLVWLVQGCPKDMEPSHTTKEESS